jgi:hypothetical protein
MTEEGMRVRRQIRRAGVLLGLLAATSGCSPVFREGGPPTVASAEAKKIRVEIVARDNRCEPSVLGVDREGRALVITFAVTSAGKGHLFLIPALNLRHRIPRDTMLEIPVVVERSGILDYACTSLPWIGPMTAKGKLAIR